MVNRRWTILPVALLPLFLGLLGPLRVAQAHGFGERYDLPLPLSFFAAGAAAAVVFSFVLMGGMIKGASHAMDCPRLDLLRHAWLRILLTRLLAPLARLLAVLLFLLVVAAGLLGSASPVENFAPTFVWVIWWVGMSFVIALLGNLWALVNPWKVLFSWAEFLYLRVNRLNTRNQGQGLDLGREYPAHWGVWPAVALFFAFSWVENALGENSTPQSLARIVLIYSGITWSGMFIFGKHQWLRHGEVFSVVFGLLSRFSITEVRVPDPAACRECGAGCGGADGIGETGCVDCYECLERSQGWELNLRPPAVGLHRGDGAGRTGQTLGAASGDGMAMVMLLLATVSFDGFSATPEWLNVQLYFLLQLPRSSIPFLSGAVIANTLGLLAFTLAFAGLYWGFTFLMHLAVARRTATGVLARTFVYTLIPISLAYLFAHYLSFLLIQGQLIIPLSSDPFGAGWDLLGTAGYKVNIGITNARFIWIFSVGAIVAGHIVAVYLAHLRSLALYPDRGLALRSQLPLLALMVSYTVVSLWIVSRPIVE